MGASGPGPPPAIALAPASVLRPALLFRPPQNGTHEQVTRPKPILLLILDGWGHRDSPEHNAIAQARCPNWQRLLAECPHTLVATHGLRVGLPDDQMGNSEVGHMNIGAGRVVYQDLT